MTTSIWIAINVALLVAIACYIVHELYQEDDPR
jgi:hypothetical protein